MNEATLMEFVNKAVGDAGALLAGSMVVLGDRLGFFHAMAGTGPMTSGELAAATGTSERHVREWLSAQAATGYITYLGDGRVRPARGARRGADPGDEPRLRRRALRDGAGAAHATDRIAEAVRSGEGMLWGTTTGTFTPGASGSSGPPTSTT